MRRIMLASLAMLVTSAGCVIVDPSCSSTAASIIVTPTVVVVAVGESFTPTATEHWCDDRRYDQSSPRWSLVNGADSAYVRLNAITGQITGLRSGRATVAARSTRSGDAATLTVTVR